MTMKKENPDPLESIRSIISSESLTKSYENLVDAKITKCKEDVNKDTITTIKEITNFKFTVLFIVGGLLLGIGGFLFINKASNADLASLQKEQNKNVEEIKKTNQDFIQEVRFERVRIRDDIKEVNEKTNVNQIAVLGNKAETNLILEKFGRLKDIFMSNFVKKEK